MKNQRCFFRAACTRLFYLTFCSSFTKVSKTISMVPLAKNKQKLLETFAKSGFIPKSNPIIITPLNEDLYELYASINEVHSVQFWDTKDLGILPFPNLFSRADQVLLIDELIDTMGNKFLKTEVSKKYRLVKFGHRTYWEQRDLDRIYAIEAYDDPFKIMNESFDLALEIITRAPRELGIVCGPISSGTKSVEENISIFARTVFKIGQEMPIFNQLPFEPGFAKAHDAIVGNEKLCPGGSSSKFFIEHFYEKLFRLPGMKWTASFIYGYRHSTGAMIEHEILSGLGSKIIELPQGFEKRFLL